MTGDERPALALNKEQGPQAHQGKGGGNILGSTNGKGLQARDVNAP